MSGVIAFSLPKESGQDSNELEEEGDDNGDDLLNVHRCHKYPSHQLSSIVFTTIQKNKVVTCTEYVSCS